MITVLDNPDILLAEAALSRAGGCTTLPMIAFGCTTLPMITIGCTTLPMIDLDVLLFA